MCRICCKLELAVSLIAAIAVDICKIHNLIYSKFGTLPRSSFPLILTTVSLDNKSFGTVES